MVHLEEVAVLTLMSKVVVLGDVGLVLHVDLHAELLLHRSLVGLPMGSLEV